MEIRDKAAKGQEFSNYTLLALIGSLDQDLEQLAFVYRAPSDFYMAPQVLRHHWSRCLLLCEKIAEKCINSKMEVLAIPFSDTADKFSELTASRSSIPILHVDWCCDVCLRLKEVLAKKNPKKSRMMLVARIWRSNPYATSEQIAASVERAMPWKKHGLASPMNAANTRRIIAMARRGQL